MAQDDGLDYRDADFDWAGQADDLAAGRRAFWAGWAVLMVAILAFLALFLD